MKKYTYIKLAESLVIENEDEYLIISFGESEYSALLNLQKQVKATERMGIDTISVPNCFNVNHVRRNNDESVTNLDFYKAVKVMSIEIKTSCLTLLYQCTSTNIEFNTVLPDESEFFSTHEEVVQNLIKTIH